VNATTYQAITNVRQETADMTQTLSPPVTLDNQLIQQHQFQKQQYLSLPFHLSKLFPKDSIPPSPRYDPGSSIDFLEKDAEDATSLFIDHILKSESVFEAIHAAKDSINYLPESKQPSGIVLPLYHSLIVRTQPNKPVISSLILISHTFSFTMTELLTRAENLLTLNKLTQEKVNYKPHKHDAKMMVAESIEFVVPLNNLLDAFSLTPEQRKQWESNQENKDSSEFDFQFQSIRISLPKIRESHNFECIIVPFTKLNDNNYLDKDYIPWSGANKNLLDSYSTISFAGSSINYVQGQRARLVTINNQDVIKSAPHSLCFYQNPSANELTVYSAFANWSEDKIHSDWKDSLRDRDVNVYTALKNHQVDETGQELELSTNEDTKIHAKNLVSWLLFNHEPLRNELHTRSAGSILNERVGAEDKLIDWKRNLKIESKFASLKSTKGIGFRLIFIGNVPWSRYRKEVELRRLEHEQLLNIEFNLDISGFLLNSVSVQ